MLIADVTLDFARKVKEADIASTTRELMDMKVHGINGEFIDGIRSSGYPGLRARDYIDLRIHGVTPALVRELKNAGYDVPAKTWLRCVFTALVRNMFAISSPSASVPPRPKWWRCEFMASPRNTFAECRTPGTPAFPSAKS